MNSVEYDLPANGYLISYENSNGETRETTIKKKILERAVDNWQNPNGEYDGMYDLYTRPGNQLVIDAKRNRWDEIPFDLDWQDHVTVDAW